MSHEIIYSIIVPLFNEELVIDESKERPVYIIESTSNYRNVNNDYEIRKIGNHQ